MEEHTQSRPHLRVGLNYGSIARSMGRVNAVGRLGLPHAYERYARPNRPNPVGGKR